MKKRMISIMLAICIVLSLVPTMVFAEENADSAPSVWAYATKEQLMDDTFAPDENGNANQIGKLIFGKNSSGAAQEWYILGTDTKIEGDNTLIFAASPMASKQVFTDNRSNYITYDSAWECGYVKTITDVRPDHYGASDLRASLRKMATDNFTAAEQEMMNVTTLLYYDEYNTIHYNTYDKLYALKGSGFQGTILYAGSFFLRPLSMSSYWNSGETFWLCSPASEFTENHNTGFLASPGGNIGPSSVYSAYAARPASNLNLSSVIFASAAKASNNIASDKIASGTAMTLRLDGSGRNIGTVTYNTTKGNIQAAKGSTTGNVALVVQGNDGTNDWYYSKQITGTETVNVSAIKSALGLSANIDLSKCEIWLETTDNDGLLYAVTVTGCSTEAELRNAIDAGVTPLTLTNDITLSSKLQFSDRNITLDLAGRVLTGDITLSDSSAAPDTILTLIDSDPATGGVLKGNITLTRGSGSVSHLYANGGTITGMASMPSYAGGIYCTSGTPTAFKGYVGNYGEIHGGIFYGSINESCIKEKTVTFMNGDSRYALEVVADGSKAAAPVEPAKTDYVFVGWFNGDTKYDFTQAVTENITLTPRWVPRDISNMADLKRAVILGSPYIRLVADLNASSTLNMSDKIITLDLNGHTLTGDIELKDTSAGSESILTLIDSNPAGGGVLNGNITLTRGNGSVSHLYANGGTITGQVSMPSYAGGIFCTSDTPTAFKDYVGNYGEIHGGMFYGRINEGCIKEKTVTFMNGGSRYALEVVADGSKVVAPASHPVKTGYAFVGWYDGDTAYTFGSTLSESITLTAEFGNPLNYDISYDLDGGTAVNPTIYTVESETITLNNPTKTGYTFTGWSGTGLSGNNNMTVTIPKGSTGSRSYTAHWTIATYTVTLNAGGGTINSGNVTGYTYGQGATLPTDVTKTGYTFAGWYDNAACTGEPVTAISATATGEKEYWAKWDANQYTITVESAENGSVTADRNTAAMGDTVTLTVVPETCYTPETLTVTDEDGDDIPVKDLGDGKYSFTMPASGVSIKVVFAENGHTLTKTEAKAATCTEEGNAEYWTCSDCGKYFSDEAGTAEIEKDSWVIAATGHSYSYTDNGDGTHTATCANCGDSFTEDHTFTDGTCVCGAVESTEPTLDSAISIGQQLTLESDLSLTFRIKESQLTAYDVSTAYLVIERDIYPTGEEMYVKTDTLTEYTIENSRLAFVYSGISAAQMNDEIRVTLHIKDSNGKDYVSNTLTTSVTAYAKLLLDAYGTTNAKLCTVLMDMLNYGTAAQIYFNRHADAPANTAYAEFANYASYASTDFVTPLEDLSSVLTNEGATATINLSVELATQIGIVYKITLPNGVNAADATVVVKDEYGNELETLSLANATVDSKGRYVVTYFGTPSRLMRRVVYGTVYVDGAAISNTYGYSISTYAYQIANTAGMPEALVNLTNLMTMYGDAANAYFGG